MFLQYSDMTTAAAAPSQFPCSGCGAALTFQPAERSLRCAHCGFENLIPRGPQDIPELDYDTQLQQQAAQADCETHDSLHCTGCGAQITPPPGVTAGSCPFCDLPFVGAARQTSAIRPAGLLPFCVNRAQAQTAFRGWLKSLWLAPSGLARLASQAEKLRGTYLPYWIFSSVATTFYSGQRGTRRQGHNGQVTISWRPVIGWVKDVLDHVLVPAAGSLPEDRLAALAPWDLARLEPYDERYLSGYFAESCAAGPAEGFARGRRIMDERIARSVQAAIGGDEQRIREIKTQFERIQFKHVLLPVWISSYRFRGSTYHFMINGRTGSVHGDRPHDPLKIALAGAAGLAGACGLGLLLMWIIQNAPSD